MIWEVLPVLIHAGNEFHTFLQLMGTEGRLQFTPALLGPHLCHLT